VSSLKEKCELTAVNILELNPLKIGDSGRIIDLEIKYSDKLVKLNPLSFSPNMKSGISYLPPFFTAPPLQLQKRVMILFN
jgi:hypothetical protein